MTGCASIIAPPLDRLHGARSRPVDFPGRPISEWPSRMRQKGLDFGEAAAPRPARRRALTVSELTERIQGVLETEFVDVWVEGEISNLKLADLRATGTSPSRTSRRRSARSSGRPTPGSSASARRTG